MSSSTSSSAPSSTSATSIAGNISKADTGTPPPQTSPDLGRLEIACPVLATNKDPNPAETQSVVKTPSTKNISHSDSDDPLTLSQAPQRRRPAVSSTRSRSHPSSTVGSLPSLSQPSENGTVYSTSFPQGYTHPPTYAPGEDVDVKAIRKVSRRTTRSKKQQSIKPSTEGGL